jgi:hypothetical protein
LILLSFPLCRNCSSALANGVISPSFGFVMSQMMAVFFLKHKRHEATQWAYVFFLLGCNSSFLPSFLSLPSPFNVL